MGTEQPTLAPAAYGLDEKVPTDYLDDSETGSEQAPMAEQTTVLESTCGARKIS